MLSEEMTHQRSLLVLSKLRIVLKEGYDANLVFLVSITAETIKNRQVSLNFISISREKG